MENIRKAILQPTRYINHNKTLQEVKEILVLGWPLILAYILHASTGVVSIAFVGHLGSTDYLAAAALGNSLVNITGYAVIYGMASPLDALGSQMKGFQMKHSQKGSHLKQSEKDGKQLGILFYRTLLILFLTCIPICFIWTYPVIILRLAGQEQLLIDNVTDYTRSLLPMAPSLVIFEGLKRYWTVLDKGKGPMIWMFCGLTTCIVSNAVFVRETGFLAFGWRGVGLSLWLGYACAAIIGIIHTRLDESVWKTLRGSFCMDIFKDWVIYLKLAIPGTAMTCSEWWAYETCAMVAGRLGNVQVSAHSVVQTFVYSLYMLPYGLSGPISVRVGTALGSANVDGTRKVMIASYFILICGMAINAAFLLASSHSIGYWFSKDLDENGVNQVAILVSKIVPIAAAYQIFDGIGACGFAILRGLGKPTIGAAVTLLSYYLIGLPLGISLALCTPLKVIGLWIGIATAIVTLSAFMLFVTLRVDLRAEIVKSQQRLRPEVLELETLIDQKSTEILTDEDL